MKPTQCHFKVIRVVLSALAVIGILGLVVLNWRVFTSVVNPAKFSAQVIAAGNSPYVITQPATGITGNTATLNGTVDLVPFTASITIPSTPVLKENVISWFTYGVNPNLSGSVRHTPARNVFQSQSSGLGSLATSLVPNQTYYYKLCAGVAGNSSLTRCGATLSFYTCPSTTPSITVLKPNGNETFTENQDITVTWVSCNFSSPTVNIILANYYPLTQWQYAATLLVAPYSTPNDGNEVVRLNASQLGVPRDFPYGRFFKIFVTDGGGPTSAGVQDESDDFFTINALPVTPTVCPKPTWRSPGSGSVPGSVQMRWDIIPSATAYNVIITDSSGQVTISYVSPPPVPPAQYVSYDILMASLPPGLTKVSLQTICGNRNSGLTNPATFTVPGLLVKFVRASSQILTQNSGSGNDEAKFDVTFSLTPYGMDAYTQDCASNATSQNPNYECSTFILKRDNQVLSQNSQGFGTTAGVLSTAPVPIPATENYKVRNGTTEEFTLSVRNHSPMLQSGNYTVQLNDIKWTPINVQSYQVYNFNLGAYRTTPLFVD